MCRYRINLQGCKHPRIATRHHESCPRSCQKPAASVIQKGKCTKCAGRKRGSLSRKVGGVNGLTNKMSGMHVSGGTKRPSARPAFVAAVRDQKKKQRKAQAAAAAAAAAARAALTPAAVVQKSGNANAQTMPHVRVVRRKD
jgi:hypothetical protein